MTSKRTISATNETATLQSVVKAVLFARLDFASGVQRFHTEIGPKTAVHPIFGSEVYTGIGDFGGISSEAKESVSGAPAKLSLSLTGVDSSLISTTLTDDYFRREADVMLGIEADDGSGDLVDDPVILFSGYMDNVIIVFQQYGGQMTLNLESRGTNLLRSSDHRFTDEDKQAQSNGDLIAEYVYRMLDVSFVWGGKVVTQGIFAGDNFNRGNVRGRDVPPQQRP